MIAILSDGNTDIFTRSSDLSQPSKERITETHCMLSKSHASLIKFHQSNSIDPKIQTDVTVSVQVYDSHKIESVQNVLGKSTIKFKIT